MYDLKGSKKLHAKAKDFKNCPRRRPRGQGRPRGRHLCQLH